MKRNWCQRAASPWRWLRLCGLHLVGLQLIWLAASGVAWGQQWPRFRGPNGTGVNESGATPAKWSDEDYNWVADLPGRGHSSPVVWGDRIFLTAGDDEAGERWLLCINAADGRIVWRHATPLTTYKKHKNNSFASSTPCVDEKHVYVVWHAKKTSPLIALNHDGRVQWTYDLGPYLHGQGGAASAITHGELVIVAHDHKRPSYLVALDRDSGKVRWKIEREGKRACYSTPVVFDSKDGAEIVFSHCYEGVIGVDPESGRVKWRADVFGRSSQRALGSPVVTDELVIATSGGVGGERQLVAIKPGRDGTAVEAWRTNKQTPHVPTPLVYRDWVFMWSDQGIASCLDRATGKKIWTKRIGGNFFGSPICVDGKLYCVDLDGNVVVIDAADTFKLRGKVALGEGAKATPAASDGVIYFRTESKLFSLGGK